MSTNEKMKKNGMLKIFLMIILIITVVILAGFAYARYVTSLNGNASMDIAKWSFNSRILNSTQTQEIADFSVTRTDNNTEVASNTIAPGTSGEFIVEIDATGTETLLTYDTKISIINKPLNLKFYSDSNKTQELVVENEQYLAFNGCISLTDNKKIDKHIYWEWKLETGTTENEIDENDIIDSQFMGKIMSMQIAVTGMQTMSNPYQNKVAQTTINGAITTYDTIQEAINAAGTNSGAIVTLLANSATESIEIGAEQDIVLNTNGKTLTYTGNIITNLGSVKILGNGNVITSGYYSCIKNYGNLKILNGNLSAGSACIYSNSTGTILILGGRISGNNGIENYGTETIIIKGGKIIGTSNHGIRNKKGYVKMYNGEIEANGDGIWTLESSGKVLVTGGKITGGTNGIVVTSSGVEVVIGVNDGNVNNNSPTIICKRGVGISCSGTGNIFFYDGIVKATGGTIVGTDIQKPTGYQFTNTTETIDEVEYNVRYLIRE